MHLSFWDNAKVSSCLIFICLQLLYFAKRPLQLIGKRNPYHTEYQAGFDADGKLQGVYINAYVDCGAAPNDNPISGLGTWGDNGTYLPFKEASRSSAEEMPVEPNLRPLQPTFVQTGSSA